MEPTKEQIETAYEPFGDEWEATMLRLPKAALVKLFRKLALDLQTEHARAERLAALLQEHLADAPKEERHGTDERAD